MLLTYILLTIFLFIQPHQQSLVPGPLHIILCLHRTDVSSCSSANTNASICRDPWKNIHHDYILSPPKVLRLSGLSYSEVFRW